MSTCIHNIFTLFDHEKRCVWPSGVRPLKIDQIVPLTFFLLIRYGSLFAMTSSRATNTEAINVDRRGNQSDRVCMRRGWKKRLAFLCITYLLSILVYLGKEIWEHLWKRFSEIAEGNQVSNRFHLTIKYKILLWHIMERLYQRSILLFNYLWMWGWGFFEND